MWRWYLQVVGFLLLGLGVGAIAYAGVDWAVGESVPIPGVTGGPARAEFNRPLVVVLGVLSLIGGVAVMASATRRR
jgi:uncharacterized membrane protein